MFTLPPRPPKDYVLKTIPFQRRSNPEFTPDAPPRVTQTTVGQFCVPIEYQDDEPLQDKDKIVKPICDKVLDKWTEDVKGSWIDKPGVNDFFLHDIHRKYSVQFDYNPRGKTREKIFNRSYTCEPEYIEMKRLEKLERKCGKEQERYQRLLFKKEDSVKTDVPNFECKGKPPFWWKTEKNSNDTTWRNQFDKESDVENARILRWQEKPDLLRSENDSLHKRRCELLRT